MSGYARISFHRVEDDARCVEIEDIEAGMTELNSRKDGFHEKRTL
jgi:hypothetical protein